MANKKNRKRNNRNRQGSAAAQQGGAKPVTKSDSIASEEHEEEVDVETPTTNESEKEEQKPAAPATAAASAPAPAPASAMPAGLAANEGILSTEERALATLLLEAGQAHLFEGWEAAGTNDAKKHDFFAQIAKLHATYPYPGGLKAYLERARALLAESAQGVNPLEGWSPEVPQGEILQPGTPRYLEMEALGEAEMGATAFVLVAGGLGERLGYSGIKVALPTETTTQTSYLEHYLKYFAALQAKYASPVQLAIMVSDDTHDRTAALLEKERYYGFPKDQVTLMKQEKVAALLDNDARIARVDGDAYAVDCKPHGHGDVHSLLHSTGLAKKWLGMGKRWLVFFQDTNALAFLSLPAALGVSKALGLEVNSLAIPRKPKQAIGAITRLKHADGRVMIVNVEYNQLDPLLRASVSPDGDVADPATGNSPYPGNINQLLFRLEPYVATLGKTHGVMGEFVNPKYADAARSVFKKPTRLECMMQDYPKVLDKEAKVGFTSLPAWASFSPVKNNAADAAKAAQGGTPPGSASSGEADQYFAGAEQLRLLGARVAQAPTKEFAGIPVSLGPRVVLAPSYALSFSELKAKLPTPDKISISGDSTLVLEGAGIELHSLALDGALVLTVPEGTTVVVKDVAVKNKGHKVVALPADEKDEVLRMRGYRIAVEEELRLAAPANAGRLVLTSDLKLVPEAEALKKAQAAAAPAAEVAAAAAVASPPVKPVRPSSASGAALTAPAPAANATAGSEEDAAAPSCWERAFGCFSKKR